MLTRDRGVGPTPLCFDKNFNWETERQKDRKTEKQKDGKTERERERKTKRQTDQQTERQTLLLSQNYYQYRN